MISDEDKARIEDIRKRAGYHEDDVGDIDCEWLLSLLDKLMAPKPVPEIYPNCEHCGGEDHPEHGCPGAAEGRDACLGVVDPLHPNGKCSCAGQGMCEWCLRTEGVVPGNVRVQCPGCGKNVDVTAQVQYLVHSRMSSLRGDMQRLTRNLAEVLKSA